jgi:glycine cleavage system aminomethyltransferase T
MSQLQAVQAAQATFETKADLKVPVSFGNDAAALAAARDSVAICDRSHWGRIQVSGGDRLRFLHNQSTNDFERLNPDKAVTPFLLLLRLGQLISQQLTLPKMSYC